MLAGCGWPAITSQRITALVTVVLNAQLLCEYSCPPQASAIGQPVIVQEVSNSMSVYYAVCHGDYTFCSVKIVILM